MSTENVELSPQFILYTIILLLLALVFWVHDITRRRRDITHRNSHLSLSWLNFGIFVSFLFISIYVFQNIIVWIGLKLNYEPEQIALAAGLATHVIGLAYIIVLKLFYPSILGRAKKVEEYSNFQAILQGFYCFLAGLPIIWFASVLWNQALETWEAWGFPIEREHQELVQLFSESSSTAFMLTIFLFAAVIAPITEEFIFRRTAYRFLKGYISARYALIFTALLFGLSHMNIMAFLPLFTIGLLLGRAYEKTGNLLTPIVFHGLFNFNTLLILVIQPDLPFYTSCISKWIH